jgi:hypothetical protein
LTLTSQNLINQQKVGQYGRLRLLEHFGTASLKWERKLEGHLNTDIEQERQNKYEQE